MKYTCCTVNIKSYTKSKQTCFKDLGVNFSYFKQKGVQNGRHRRFKNCWAIHIEGDIMLSAKVVELAVVLSDEKDPAIIHQNIRKVIDYMKMAKRQIGEVKRLQV